MTASDLTERDLAALGIWCAYLVAGHGSDMFSASDYPALTEDQKTKVREAQTAATEGITDALAAMYGSNWEDRIEAIEAAGSMRAVGQ